MDATSNPLPFRPENQPAHFHLDFYHTSNGKTPLEDFLDGLDTKVRVKAIQELSLLEEFGNEIRESFSKHIKNGIFELRILSRGTCVRIFYFFLVGHRIIATNGFIKKTSKTPSNELIKALRCKADWEMRNK